jgi:hypothetical protein
VVHVGHVGHVAQQHVKAGAQTQNGNGPGVPKSRRNEKQVDLQATREHVAYTCLQRPMGVFA